jgi:hypothetical protein
MDKDMERFESLVNSYKLSPYFLQPHDPLELLTGFLATRPPAALLHELAVQGSPTLLSAPLSTFNTRAKCLPRLSKLPFRANFCYYVQ